MGMGRGPGGPMMGSGEKAKNFKSTMKQFIGYLKPYWASVIVVLVFAIAGTSFSIVGPKVLGQMTNQIVNDYVSIKAYDQITATLPAGTVIQPGTTGAMFIQNMPAEVQQAMPNGALDAIRNMDLSQRPSLNTHRLTDIGLVLVGLYLLSTLFTYIQGWVMSGVSQKVTYEFRRELAAKINRMPLRYFDSKTHGEVLSRVTNDIDTVSQSLNQSLSQIVTSVTMIIGILIMMLTISWQLTLVALLILPLSMGLIAVIMKKSQIHFKNQQATLGDLNGHIEEMYSGHNVMKVMNGEQRSVAKFQTINTRLYDSAWKSQFLSGLMFPIMNFVGNLGYVGMAILGGYLASKGQIQIGDLQAFIQYMRQFNQPIVQTATVANVLQSTAAAAERVFEFLAEAEEKPEDNATETLNKVKGDIEFSDVFFGYAPDKTIIHDFSAHIRSGQRVAIVGPTGAGKTTMVNLLMRFYDVDTGAIKLDGIDTREMKRHEVRRQFGMVLQDTWLFHGTIRANIAYGNPDATDAEILTAAKAAQVDHFVNSLPGGYDFELNEEADNISQGEKQLLTIARAMLAHTPMLILDEATSSVDTRTEVLIQKAMDNLMKGKTSFVIAHRLSTIRDADLILVMKDGNIVEQGKHDDLLKLNGFYADLYNSQFAGEEAA